MNHVVHIVKGEDKRIEVKLKDQATSDPYSLEGVTGIKALFPGGIIKDYVSGDPNSKVKILSDAILGHISIKLEEEDTNSLPIGQVNFELEITKGDETIIVQFEKVLMVKDRVIN